MPCQKSGLCNISYERFSETRFTQTYKALCWDAMFVFLSGGKKDMECLGSKITQNR